MSTHQFTKAVTPQLLLSEISAQISSVVSIDTVDNEVSILFSETLTEEQTNTLTSCYSYLFYSLLTAVDSLTNIPFVIRLITNKWVQDWVSMFIMSHLLD